VSAGRIQTSAQERARSRAVGLACLRAAGRSIGAPARAGKRGRLPGLRRLV